MRCFPPAILSIALLLGLPAAAVAQDTPTDTPSQDDGTSAGEATGFRNVDIVEAGRFRMRDKRGYRNLVIIGPRFLPPGVNVRYDRLFGDRISLLVGTGFGRLGFKSSDDDIDGTTRGHISSWRALVGMNWHPVRNGMHGFFLGPRLQYAGYAVSVDGGGSGSVTTLDAGAAVGWRWIWDPGFSLGLGLGGGYRAVVTEAAASDEDGEEVSTGFNYQGFWPIVEFTLGWAF